MAGVVQENSRSISILNCFCSELGTIEVSKKDTLFSVYKKITSLQSNYEEGDPVMFVRMFPDSHFMWQCDPSSEKTYVRVPSEAFPKADVDKVARLTGVKDLSDYNELLFNQVSFFAVVPERITELTVVFRSLKPERKEKSDKDK